jgi:hypothetical protein
MASMKRVVGLVEILGSHEQFGSTDCRVHPARIVGPDHGLDPDFVQDAFRYLRIRAGRKRRDDGQI